ncbi:MAG TPA: DUF4019 domain-containing protein [Candidatus Acidoferrum sp.]|jgi:hypothetical protein|nr:DUF4019 domain-containing protein [Candidatus Acidoferrum sp.]
MGVRGRILLTVRYLVAICVAGILLCSCGSSAKNLQLAEQNVEQFHSELDSEQYAAVYAASDEKFHQATSESDFVKLLEAIHRKLGNVQQANLHTTGVAWFAGQGATVTLVYQTKFAEGAGTEQFVWHVKDDGAALYSYRINSNELVAGVLLFRP